MNRQSTSPSFPSPPEEYDQDYMRNILRQLDQFVAQVRAIGPELLIQASPVYLITDVAMPKSSVQCRLDEAGNKLDFRVKYSDGTIKTGTVTVA